MSANRKDNLDEQKAKFFTAIKFRENKIDGHCSHTALNSAIILLHLAETADIQPSSPPQASGVIQSLHVHTMGCAPH